MQEIREEIIHRKVRKKRGEIRPTLKMKDNRELRVYLWRDKNSFQSWAYPNRDRTIQAWDQEVTNFKWMRIKTRVSKNMNLWTSQQREDNMTWHRCSCKKKSIANFSNSSTTSDNWEEKPSLLTASLGDTSSNGNSTF